MDTTIALFFSLGIVMNPSSEPAKEVQSPAPEQIMAQQSAQPNPKLHKRHELVKGRIAATNAWLANQRKERRDLAKIHQPIQVSLNQNIQSCGASWNLT